ncbi:MAG TPA: phospholipase, partial [Thermotoga sp.]|nr:phospholipase [Thermotoga sp.]
FGSANLTESGLHKNVEVLFKTQERDFVKDFIEEFERLWEDGFIQGFRF